MKVRVFSTSTCPWCNVAKQFLKDSHVEFEEVDVSADPHAAQEMVRKSGQRGVPVIEIDGKMIVGFNKEALKKALALK